MTAEPDATPPRTAPAPACPRCEQERWSSRRRRLRAVAVTMLAVSVGVGACAAVIARRSTRETDALLAAIAVVRAADTRAPSLSTLVAANTRCARSPTAGDASSNASLSLYELWADELRCPPSVEASIAGASQWDSQFWQSHLGPRSAVALRAGLVALAQDRRQCPSWSASARALELYGNAASAHTACANYSDLMAEFLRDKVTLVRATAARPAHIGLACAVTLALAALVAGLGARRCGRRMRHLLANARRGPYRSSLPSACARHGG